nr:hypothetical protein BaRGS_010952 [Batillaria attramentaria]
MDEIKAAIHQLTTELLWAKLLLLYVCVLACLLIGPSLSLRDNEETKFEKSLMGASGEVCTKQGRKCIRNDTAACVNNRCTCLRGFKGEAEIECVNKINATNQFLDGRYVVSSVNITVGVGDGAHMHQNAFDVYKTFNYSMNDSTIYNVHVMMAIS